MILIDYRIQKNNMNSHQYFKFAPGQKLNWTNVSLDINILGLMHIGRMCSGKTFPCTNETTAPG